MTVVHVIGATAVLTLRSSGSIVEVDALASFAFFVGEAIWIWQTRQFLRSLYDDAQRPTSTTHAE